MALPPTGSEELVYIQTAKVSLSIKGRPAHPAFTGVGREDGDSGLTVVCNEAYELTVSGQKIGESSLAVRAFYSAHYPGQPLFFEQQGYELVIEPVEGHRVEFWHENLNVRNKVSQTGRRLGLLSGVINFGNDIGYSDLVVKVDGQPYLRLTIEVFPSKISYKEDYQSILADVTAEVYNVVFDFLKKTYLGYRQNDRVNSSPVEFFAVIRAIYRDFLKAADLILAQPHHVLTTIHAVLPAHKAKHTDARTVRWLAKHPERAQRNGQTVVVSHALAAKKHLSYDTPENRLTKYIIQSTSQKLTRFKQNYLRLLRAEDAEVLTLLDNMIRGLDRRGSATFFAEVGSYKASTSMSLVFSMAPGYRELYKYYLMLMRGLSISGDLFRISVKDLAQLYEYWCFIKLNSFMKDRYELVSQDILKVQGNGLFVALVKGQGSRVKYRNPVNGEKITLSYNPSEIDVPTVNQRPDNVLTLEKKGATTEYKYIFDAKYRLNAALSGSYYYNSISSQPGPEVDDINTMHRYRDAIVYKQDSTSFARGMFGAYVLFPYKNEEEYRKHRFYESIDKVNIGGLPFLPSATRLVSAMLDELIADSPDTALERAPLPTGIEEKLARVDWNTRDVLVGALRNRDQLEICLQNNFYHVPKDRIPDGTLPIRYVAIYQSKKLFGQKSGIYYYGEVIRTIPVARNEISEIPKHSDDAYYRFEIKSWTKLDKPIAIKEKRNIHFYTNLFLLTHSSEVPELYLRSEEEYRLYNELKRAHDSTSINDPDTDLSFRFRDTLVVFEEGRINLYADKKLRASYTVADFGKRPGLTVKKIIDET